MRILIADDHALFRDGLRSLLEARGVEVVGEARNGREAVDLAHACRPDIVLMDLVMPELSGVEATKQILDALPGVKVVVLTASEDSTALYEVIKLGVHGYLLKNLESDTFFDLLQRVDRGEPAVPPMLAHRLLRQLVQPNGACGEDPAGGLTEREVEVLTLLVQGVTSNRALAKRLVVSENTVKYHLRNILTKLQLHDRAEVVAYAIRHGLVDRSKPS